MKKKTIINTNILKSFSLLKYFYVLSAYNKSATCIPLKTYNTDELFLMRPLTVFSQS